jgi:hypothetical protein
MTSTAAVDKFLHAIETATIPGCDAWSADATLDATVPGGLARQVAGRTEGLLGGTAAQVQTTGQELVPEPEPPAEDQVAVQRRAGLRQPGLRTVQVTGVQAVLGQAAAVTRSWPAASENASPSSSSAWARSPAACRVRPPTARHRARVAGSAAASAPSSANWAAWANRRSK